MLDAEFWARAVELRLASLADGTGTPEKVLYVVAGLHINVTKNKSALETARQLLRWNA